MLRFLRQESSVYKQNAFAADRVILLLNSNMFLIRDGPEPKSGPGMVISALAWPVES